MILLPPAVAMLIVVLALLLLLLIALAPLFGRGGQSTTDERTIRACAYNLANYKDAHCFCGQHG